MIYYLYHLEWKNKKKETDNEEVSKEKTNVFEDKYNESVINDMNEEFRRAYLRDESFLLFISDRTKSHIVLCVAVSINCAFDVGHDVIILESFRDCYIKGFREITVQEFIEEISMERSRSGFRIRSILNVDYRDAFMDPMPFEKSEEIFDASLQNKAQCKKRAKRILASKSLLDELDRIYSRENVKLYYGHPVHYIISACDWKAATDISRILVSALNNNRRLICGRQTIIRNIHKDAYKDPRYKMVLEAAEGGVVIMELKDHHNVGCHATDFHEFTSVTGNILKEMKKDTLFIFIEITGESLKSDADISNITSQADFIQINEGSGTLNQARDYLMELEENADFKVSDKEEIFSYLPKQSVYTVSDIFSAYNAWYGSGLKNHVYKAYKNKTTYKVEVTANRIKPYDELQDLVGLDEIKKIVESIICAGKVEVVRERMGLNTEGSSMHMVFTGTPGTAKTTVARLLAKILREEEIITSGRFIECGRQDLVGKYVGWTAKQVEEKFREAQGGILFIDEAYSLVDDSNSYGAEAINTITQMMENYRDKVIVIFAGYPDKMSEFLNQNEGLRSRIAFHLNFPDYNTDELLQILKLMCKNRQYEITDEASSKCFEMFKTVACIKDYGNGRYVRNVLEQAILRQSNRIIQHSNQTGSKLTKTDVIMLEADDFQPISLGDRTKYSRIGFAV